MRARDQRCRRSAQDHGQGGGGQTKLGLQPGPPRSEEKSQTGMITNSKRSDGSSDDSSDGSAGGGAYDCSEEDVDIDDVDAFADDDNDPQKKGADLANEVGPLFMKARDDRL